jgi:hypothetical protein
MSTPLRPQGASVPLGFEMCAWLAEILELHCGILASYCKKGSYGESKMSENDLED